MNELKVAQSYNYKSEYANYLQTFNWDFFATFTTRYSLTLPSARRVMERLHSRAANKYGGIRLFWVAEPFDCKDGYHTHALVFLKDRLLKEIPVKPEVDFTCLKQSWDIVSKSSPVDTNWTTLKRYDPELGACGYVGKYILKKNSDYDLLL